MLKEFGSGPFPVISIFASTAHYQLFFPVFFKFFLQTLAPPFYLLSDHKTFLPSQGISYWELVQIKLKHSFHHSHNGPELRQAVLSSLLNVALILKNSAWAYVFSSDVSLWFSPLEVFYVSNWFVMLQRYDYKAQKTNQWISVIWILKHISQSIHSETPTTCSQQCFIFICFLSDQYL